MIFHKKTKDKSHLVFHKICDTRGSMKIKGRRIFNCRPMVFFALALVLGILVAESMYGASV